MFTHLCRRPPLAATLSLSLTLSLGAAGQAHATDKFKVTEVACEMSWYSKHTPVISYDIVAERQADYLTTPSSDYFRQAAERTREYCDRTSKIPQSAFGAPRVIRGIWFKSNDGRFSALYSFDVDALDQGATVVNRIGDQHAAEEQAVAQKAEAERRHASELEQIRTRDVRARELKDAKEQAARASVAAQYAREQPFFDSRDLQIARFGTEVGRANVTTIENVRTNPFHFKKLGLAVVAAAFNRMVSDKWALFGNELAPIYIHIEDVDRFTRSGEVVVLAFKVRERVEAERSFGSLPEFIMSAMKADTILGEYVGAYSCPANDCSHVFDGPPGSSGRG